MRTGNTAAFTCFPTWRPTGRRICFWLKHHGLSEHLDHLQVIWLSKKHHCTVRLFPRVLFGRCIVAERQRKTTTTNQWRRMWVTVINTPTSWCSAMPANCFETTKGLFTTNMENILSHGWGTRASWLIGRLNKLRPKHYANHLSCPLACFKIQGTTWSLSCRSLEILATDDECFTCFLAC